MKRLFALVWLMGLLTAGWAQEGAIRSKTIRDFERAVRNTEATKYVFVVPDHLSGNIKIETIEVKPEEVRIKKEVEQGAANWAFLAQTFRFGQVIKQGLVIYLHPGEEIEVLNARELAKLEAMDANGTSSRQIP